MSFLLRVTDRNRRPKRTEKPFQRAHHLRFGIAYFRIHHQLQAKKEKEISFRPSREEPEGALLEKMHSDCTRNALGYPCSRMSMDSIRSSLRTMPVRSRTSTEMVEHKYKMALVSRMDPNRTRAALGYRRFSCATGSPARSHSRLASLLSGRMHSQ